MNPIIVSERLAALMSPIDLPVSMRTELYRDLIELPDATCSIHPVVARSQAALDAASADARDAARGKGAHEVFAYLAELQQQRDDVEARFANELAVIDGNIAKLTKATKVVTPELEAVYAELLELTKATKVVTPELEAVYAELLGAELIKEI